MGKGLRGRCGCGVGFNEADQDKTCAKHEVIFCRTCRHADSTLKYLPITTIECRECLGRAICSEARNVISAFEKLFESVSRDEEQLQKARENGDSGPDIKVKLRQATERRKNLKNQKRSMLLEVVGRFTQYYGPMEWEEWNHKVCGNVKVDAEDFEREDVLLYFKKIPDDVHNEMEAIAKLRSIERDLNKLHVKNPDQTTWTSDEKEAFVDALVQLYEDQTITEEV